MGMKAWKIKKEGIPHKVLFLGRNSQRHPGA
jgi:hypothetical protein